MRQERSGNNFASRRPTRGVRDPTSILLASGQKCVVIDERRVAIGFETYSEAGAVRRLNGFAANDESTFLAVNTRFGRWDVNFGVGHGYGANHDKLILKAIIGVRID